MANEMQQMASPLTRRGPEGTGIWRDGAIGLGHTLLTTTSEAQVDRLPLTDPATDCMITADVRLDNRTELLDALGLRNRAAAVSDAGLILAAYLAWGSTCVQFLLGDFAFVIWDPKCSELFCARDHFGVRPFYYHHTNRQFFAFASEPRAILVLPQTPYRINERRIADFLIEDLEGIDKTSTFFEEVFRLPPAHTLSVTAQGIRLQRYWTHEPVPELRLSSDEEYAEAFLDVFSKAVHCRLRGAATVGSMLSGGIDSGSIVAVARELRAHANQPLLPTFSAMGPTPATCVETRAVCASLTMGGLDPHIVNFAELDDLLPDLKELTWDLAEPFDNQMTLARVVYLIAHRWGIKSVLDGVGADVSLSESSYIAHLLRQGRGLTAYREAEGLNNFYGGGYPAWRDLYNNARAAFIPNPVRHLSHRLLGSRREQDRMKRVIGKSLIRPSFARRVMLRERLNTMYGSRPAGFTPEFSFERSQLLDKAFLTVAIERYDRVASAVAIEPRHPFLDQRMVAFSLSLPPEQLLAGGWPKVILRRAVAGRLPDAVRWRRGKEHVGWAFTEALMESMHGFMQQIIDEKMLRLLPYVDADSLRSACQSFFNGGDLAQAGNVYDMAHLAAWLHRNEGRPQFDQSRSSY